MPMASWTDVAVRPSAWGMPSSPQRLLEPLAVFGPVDGVHRRAQHGTPASARGSARLMAVWPPNWTRRPSGCSRSMTFEHVLQRQRLEVEPVGRVEVGADRLGVVVDDDGLVARLPQRPHRMDRAVVELDALPDADRPGAHHQHLRRARAGAPSAAAFARRRSFRVVVAACAARIRRRIGSRPS